VPSLVVFPRGRVLLPKQRLRLRVHDTFITRAIGDASTFAAFFTPAADRLSRVGVEARILHRFPASHDRVDLEVVGGERLQGVGEQVGHLRNFDYLEDLDGPGDLEELRSEVERAWRRYAAAAVESGRGLLLESSIHPDPRIASYQLGTMMPISHPERQELLEIPTTSERLDRVLLYLAGETGLLRHMLGLGRMGA